VRPQSQLDFSPSEWQDHADWLCLSMDVRREGSRHGKTFTVMVDHVTNPEHPLFGAWLVSSCWAREGAMHRTRCSSEAEAKHRAETLMDSLMDAIRSDELNWWTGEWQKQGAQ